MIQKKGGRYHRIIHRDDKAVIDLPLKLIVVTLILAISLPIVFSGLKSIQSNGVESNLRNEIIKLITVIKQANGGAPGTSFPVTVNFRENSFQHIDYVRIGDSPDGADSSVIWYKLADRNPEPILISDPEIMVTSVEYQSLELGAGKYELIVEHMEENGIPFVVVR